jgi:hypothetical protein
MTALVTLSAVLNDYTGKPPADWRFSQQRRAYLLSLDDAHV